MEITGNLDVRDISPRVINGWSDISFEDDETTAADFFEAVRQAIIERACACGISVGGHEYFDIKKLSEYTITQNTLSYEIFEIIEKAIYEISPYFLCGIDDISSSVIGYKYREDLRDFPFVLGDGIFGINDDIAFFKRPSIMPTWNEMKSSGYAYRLMNAINAMTSMTVGLTRKTRNTIVFRHFSRSMEWNDFVKHINEEIHDKFIDSYLGEPDKVNVYYYGTRVIEYVLCEYYDFKYVSAYFDNEEVFSAFHPGAGIGADCMLRYVFATGWKGKDYIDSHGNKHIYINDVELISIKKIDPVFCPHDRMIYSPEPCLEIASSFSPSVFPPDSTGKKVDYYHYAQEFSFFQYYDFGIPGGFRFRKDT